MSFVKWELPAVVWAAVLLFLTWWPKIEIPDIGIDYKDKIAHVLTFALLGFLTARAVSKNEINRLPKAVKLTMIYCVLFAIFDEAMQGVIPGRVADVWDGAANVFGIFLSVIVFYYLWFPWRTGRINRHSGLA